ncbi:helix-turn-helix domain-containing protein [Sandaracinobacteroides hominis]|uniref:helix-turn-helix domain-containing protein n=1 Tax=Sandaracinobacteroides hominis TaxID=2780086 RepID=UPI0018F63FFF|nr:helix-turn-helix transcriptional regulator [Sandaracinobacteroides hominis]
MGLSDVDLAARVARLTAGQRECLDLVDDHATSKEIARQLGISRHTVDARLRGAIQTLGVTSRREAAIIYRAAMLAQGYQPAAPAHGYQPFAYQSPRIVSETRTAENLGQAQLGGDFDGDYGDGVDGDVEREPEADFPPLVHASRPQPAGAHAGQAHRSEPMGLVSDSAVWTAVSTGDFSQRDFGQKRQILRLWGGANDLNPTQRMFGILIVMILAMLAFGLLLSGIEALTLLRS